MTRNSTVPLVRCSARSNVVDADDFAAVRINDLLVQQILADGEPRFVRLVMFEVFLVDPQLDDAGADERYLIVAGDQRLIFAAAKEIARDAVGLIGRDKNSSEMRPTKAPWAS